VREGLEPDRKVVDEAFWVSADKGFPAVITEGKLDDRTASCSDLKRLRPAAQAAGSATPLRTTGATSRTPAWTIDSGAGEKVTAMATTVERRLPRALTLTIECPSIQARDASADVFT